MKLKLIIITFLFSALNLAQAQQNNLTHKDSLNYTLNQYYKLNLKVFQQNSTLKDIDNIFTLFTDDFTYAHPKYGGVYTREDLYNGYKRNQNNGGYDGSVVDIKIENIIYGLNAITVSKRFITKEEGKVVKGDKQMALFEFKDGKIFMIKEYW
ncbi:nuclear transport factor 2 family protein [Flavobacteriaceae bacterium S0825]|uniref:nuclear transport factor 2 family protein n=1 Tax=Gaetbulibacter sp. S0825 TaxID=2720084 RepID=UPI00143077F4|nr:nuclear transport factor 2 family protein [Gaetbulibacter sp. S0825]MCK0107906.1 nuclear transport factor 2 family protein [Flavobacteriaceae bacterium S0825]NIX63542.1 nuclear transport factor 2 family protein [Gaetbulibacter sp. S0825]